MKSVAEVLAELSIKCAYADLQGALEAYEQGNMNIHDWKAHATTIKEMAERFSFLNEGESKC